jgi:glycosyltransferase involved in cell wall biosynthesis
VVQGSEGELDSVATADTLVVPAEKGRERRICFAIESLEMGGAEIHALAIARHLLRRGWHVLFAVMSGEGALTERCREAGIEVCADLMPSRRGWGVVRQFSDLADRWRFDTLFVIECFYMNALFAYQKAIRRTGGRAYAIIHNWPSRREFTHPALFTTRVGLMNHLFDRVIFISKGQREHYEQQLKVRFKGTEVITSGIDVNAFVPGESEKDPLRRELGTRHKRVGIVASLQARKGHEDFLQAAAAILSKRPGVEFLIIGDGPRRAELRRMVHELQIDGSVHFLGIRDDLPDLLRALDVLVLASHEASGGGHAETLPLVLLEAGATALPVVATDVGAVSEIVVNKRTGFVVPPQDVGALAEKIGVLLANPALRTEMGTIARERIVAKFNAERMCLRFEELFRYGY